MQTKRVLENIRCKCRNEDISGHLEAKLRENLRKIGKRDAVPDADLEGAHAEVPSAGP